MKLTHTKDIEMSNFTLDLEQEEASMLIRYALRNIPKQRHKELLIEWAVTNLLENAIKDRTD